MLIAPKRVPRAVLFLSMLSILALAACSASESTSPTPSDTTYSPDQEFETVDLSDLEQFANAPEGPAKAIVAHGGHSIVVPAGSVDALASAIANAGSGTVLLEAGDHYESDTVLINHRVTLVGEAGAVLRSGIPGAETTQAVLHLQGANNSIIWGISFAPDGAYGATGLLVEDSDRVSLVRNTFNDFAFSILIEQSDDTRIWQNSIHGTPLWQDGTLGSTFGVVSINGHRTALIGSEISDSLFGFWACGRYGTAIGNNFHDNFIGLILCKVPAGGFVMPDGSETGSAEAASRWLVMLNDASNSFHVGFLAIDGAYDNVLFNNSASNNALYDIELAGDSYRFGFLTPTSSATRAYAGSYTGLVVKDCGVDNQMIGFDSIVDNSADPCF